MLAIDDRRVYDAAHAWAAAAARHSFSPFLTFAYLCAPATMNVVMGRHDNSSRRPPEITARVSGVGATRHGAMITRLLVRVFNHCGDRRVMWFAAFWVHAVNTNQSVNRELLIKIIKLLIKSLQDPTGIDNNVTERGPEMKRFSVAGGRSTDTDHIAYSGNVCITVEIVY